MEKSTSETSRSEFEKDYGKYVKAFTPEEIAHLTSKVKLLCGIHGVLFRCKDNPKLFKHIPITLFPTPFPAEHLQTVRSIQEDVNMLLHRISNDYDFIVNSLAAVCKADPFIQKQVNIFAKVQSYPFAQNIQAGIIRSDYMINDSRNSKKFQEVKLVEYNTVSVSFGAHSPKVQVIHDDILKCAQSLTNDEIPSFNTDKNKAKISEGIRDFITDIAVGLSTSWLEYVKDYSTEKSCILFVVQPSEQNIFDHAKIELQLRGLIRVFGDKYSIYKTPAVFYRTIQELHDCLSVEESDGALKFIFDKKQPKVFEVALVYFRSGYSPTDYINDKCWSVRETIELSRAIKVPTIGLQLTGCKKIQQLLTYPEVISRYLPKETAQKILSTFIGTYSLDQSSKVHLEELFKKIKENPDEYVLKPQREGGGNNVYGGELLKLVEKAKSDTKSLDSYILMEMIHPTLYPNYLVHSDKDEATFCQCISEIGIWGVYVAKGFQFKMNLKSGYLLRTKPASELDGGVASGRAVLDSMCLY